jgi:hypothetical protein
VRGIPTTKKEIVMSKAFAALMAAGLFASIIGTTRVVADGDNLPAGYQLLYEQSCEKPDAMKDFVFSDPTAWRIGKDKKGEAALELFAKGTYEPKNRSPLNIALVKTKRFGDFRLDAELMSTTKPYPHQDMCVFFSFVSPEKFDYAHLALRQDEVAHRVIVVNEAPRAVIPTEGNKGVKWDQNVWHKVRLERKASDGSVRVFFDDMTTPVETANDKTFGTGHVGFGSFDDKGMVRNIKIYGATSEAGDADFFKPSEK